MTFAPTPGTLSRGSGRLASFTGRLQGLLASPLREWRDIAVEPTTAADVYWGYVAPLAGAAAAGAFLANTLIGVDAGYHALRAGLLPAFAGALLGFALAFVGVNLLSRLTARLVANAREDLRLPALRVVAYSMTPVWLAAIVTSVPMLGVLAWAGGLYALVLLILGMRAVLRQADLQAVGYAVIVALCGALFAIFTLFAVAFANGVLGLGRPAVAPGYRDAPRVIGAAGSILGRIVGESDAAGRARMTDAVGTLFGSAFDALRGRQSVDPFDQLLVTAAVIGGAGKVLEPVPAASLVRLLPTSLPGMRRIEVTSRPENVKSLHGNLASARYESNGATITLTVGDAGEAAGLLRLYAWFDPFLDKSTASGYDRRRRYDGHFLKEEYNRSDRKGKVAMIVDDRFVIGAEGANVDDAALLEAVRAVDARMLVALARAPG